MKPRIKSVIWNIRKKKKHSTRTARRKKNPKNKKSPRILWDNFKHTNIQIIVFPNGEENEQEIENLLVKIMKENFPNLVKEIDMQAQEAQRVPNKDGCKEDHNKTHHN